MFFWTTTFKSNVEKWLFDTKDLFFAIDLIIIDCCEPIIFSEMKVGVHKSELLREDSGQSICCFLFFFHHLNIFSNQIDHYCLVSINHSLRNELRPKLSKANFYSKTVGTVFAVFVLHSTSFTINLMLIV